MPDNSPPRSAYEIAMERLRKKDTEAGVEQKPLTDEQKTAIAEIRSLYEAKLAEVELLHQGQVLSIMDPAQLAEREQQYRRDRDRLSRERDAKIEKARRDADSR